MKKLDFAMLSVKKNHLAAVKFSIETYQELKIMSRKTKVPISTIVRCIVENYMKEAS